MCATLYWVLLTVSFGTRPIVSITLTCDKTITFSGVSKRAKTTTSNSSAPKTINILPHKFVACPAGPGIPCYAEGCVCVSGVATHSLLYLKEK